MSSPSREDELLAQEAVLRSQQAELVAEAARLDEEKRQLRAEKKKACRRGEDPRNFGRANRGRPGSESGEATSGEGLDRERHRSRSNHALRGEARPT